MAYPLRLSQIRSVLVRNLDTRTSSQSSCFVVDCYCELHAIEPTDLAAAAATTTTTTTTTTTNIIHTSHSCKETLNPRWFLPQEEQFRLS